MRWKEGQKLVVRMVRHDLGKGEVVTFLKTQSGRFEDKYVIVKKADGTIADMCSVERFDALGHDFPVGTRVEDSTGRTGTVETKQNWQDWCGCTGTTGNDVFVIWDDGHISMSQMTLTYAKEKLAVITGPAPISTKPDGNIDWLAKIS